MTITLDMKTSLALLSVAALLGGFYYTTQIRLTSLEVVTEGHAEELADLRRAVKRRAPQ